MGTKYNPRVVTNGLQVYLDAGNTRSYSGSGNTANGLIAGFGGTLVNGTGFSSANGGSFYFDGTNDIINVPSIDINSSFTIGVFFQGLNDSRTNIIVGKYAGGNTDFWLGTTNIGGYKIWFSVTNGSNPSKIEPKSSAISTGVFYYATGVYDSSTFTASLYVNGVLQQSSTGSTGFANPTGNYTIGDYSIGTPFSAPFQGNVGLHHYYNRALSANEVLQNYNALKKRFSL